jgi:hypothetical protein
LTRSPHESGGRPRPGVENTSTSSSALVTGVVRVALPVGNTQVLAPTSAATAVPSVTDVKTLIIRFAVSATLDITLTRLSLDPTRARLACGVGLELLAPSLATVSPLGDNRCCRLARPFFTVVKNF